MSLITRIDSRSINNSAIHIVDTATGYILATIESKNGKCELGVRTAPMLHIEKPNGFTTKKEDDNA